MRTALRSLTVTLALAIVLLGSLVACAKQEAAQTGRPFRELTQAESERLDEQRAVIATAVNEHYGVRGLTKTKTDLPVLQRLIDDRVFSEKQSYELRCLGVAFGDVLVSELPLRWMTMTDPDGPRPTLRFKDTPRDINTLSLMEKEGAYQSLNLSAELETLRKQLSGVDTTARPGGYLEPADVTKIVIGGVGASRQTVYTAADEEYSRMLSLYNDAKRVEPPRETTNDYSVMFYTRQGAAAGVFFLAGDSVLMVQTPHGETFGIVSDQLADMARHAVE